MYSFFYSSFLSCTLVRWSLLLPFRYLIHVYAYIPLTVDTFVITSTWPNQRWIYYYNTKFDIHFIVLTQFSLSWTKLCIGGNEDEWWMDGVANDNRVSYILLESSVDCPKIMSITNRSTSTELPNLGESEGRKKKLQLNESYEPKNIRMIESLSSNSFLKLICSFGRFFLGHMFHLSDVQIGATWMNQLHAPQHNFDGKFMMDYFILIFYETWSKLCRSK